MLFYSHIVVVRSDPFYNSLIRHVQGLYKRYGPSLVILNLVKVIFLTQGFKRWKEKARCVLHTPSLEGERSVSRDMDTVNDISKWKILYSHINTQEDLAHLFLTYFNRAMKRSLENPFCQMNMLLLFVISQRNTDHVTTTSAFNIPYATHTLTHSPTPRHSRTFSQSLTHPFITLTLPQISFCIPGLTLHPTCVFLLFCLCPCLFVPCCVYE